MERDTFFAHIENVDWDVDKEQQQTDNLKSPGAIQERQESRRKFTRNALVGGTVILSFGNRSAWGEGDTTPEGCSHFHSMAASMGTGQLLDNQDACETTAIKEMDEDNDFTGPLTEESDF